MQEAESVPQTVWIWRRRENTVSSTGGQADHYAGWAAAVPCVNQASTGCELHKLSKRSTGWVGAAVIYSGRSQIR
jgi:hypothetical protein